MIQKASTELGLKVFLQIMRSVLLLSFILFLVTYVLIKIFGVENKPNSFLIFSLIIPVSLILFMTGLSTLVSLRAVKIVNDLKDNGGNIKWLKVLNLPINSAEFQEKIKNTVANYSFTIEKDKNSISYYIYSSYSFKTSGAVVKLNHLINDSEIKIAAKCIFPREKGNDEFLKSIVENFYNLIKG